jgi:hypothetical protein
MNMPSDTFSVNERQAIDLSKYSFSAGDILNEIEQLRKLIENETQYLKNVNLPSLKELAPQKEKIVNSISAKLSLIKRNKNALKDANLYNKQQILEVEKKLGETLESNFQTLSKAKRMNELMISIITRAVKKMVIAENGLSGEQDLEKESFSIVYNQQV